MIILIIMGRFSNLYEVLYGKLLYIALLKIKTHIEQPLTCYIWICKVFIKIFWNSSIYLQSNYLTVLNIRSETLPHGFYY